MDLNDVIEAIDQHQYLSSETHQLLIDTASGYVLKDFSKSAVEEGLEYLTTINVLGADVNSPIEELEELLLNMEDQDGME